MRRASGLAPLAACPLLALDRRLVPGRALASGGALVAVLVLAASLAPGDLRAEPGREIPALAPRPGPCEACAPPEGSAIHRLGEAEIDSIGRSFSEHNQRLWARTDSLYRAGFFGLPGSGSARTRARLHFMLRARNGLDYLVLFGTAARRFEISEASVLRPFGERFANAAIYPLRRLRDSYVGRGGFCLQYEIDPRVDERVTVGGLPLRLRADRAPEENGRLWVPALSQQVQSKLHKSIEMIFRERFCGRVTHETWIDRGDTLEVIAMQQVEGMYVRKAGTHRLQAVILWRSRVEGDRDPEVFRVGGCAYFPHIQIRLSFLPDLGLDDLRDFDLPQPLVPVDWVRHVPEPDWIRVGEEGIFGPWDAVGPRPEELARRFPDL